MERPTLVGARTLAGGVERAPDPALSSEAQPPTALTVENLQGDLDALAKLLEQELGNRSALDAYLLAAGINQIAEDHLHPEIYPFDRAAAYLAESGPLGRVARGATAALAGAGRGIAKRRRVTTRVLRWQREVARLVETLAGDVAGMSGSPSASSSPVLASVEDLPLRLRRKMIRLPACFQSFDQQPADLARLVGDFSKRWPRRGRPLLVVGIRTSGSYLAPLCAAFLRAEGYERVQVLTIRPGRPLLEHELELARSIASEDGIALLTDDPPVTGSGVESSARELEQAGFAPESLVLLLQVFGAGLPAVLDRYPAVVLPWETWTVIARLAPEVVERELSALIGPHGSVLQVDALSPPRRSRGHVRARFRVRMRGRPGVAGDQQQVVVEGIGLGYFGSPPLVATRLLEGFAPKLFGARDGLLYREWLPDERRAAAVDEQIEPAVARGIAAYVSERHRALPVAEDMSLRLVGEQPAWEVASTILSRAFGRAWPLAKVLVMDRVVKRLLHVSRSSVVDGSTDLDHWFSGERSGDLLVKVQPAEGPFSHLGLSCFDPAFDLAGATARIHDPSFARRLRDTYAELDDAAVDQERIVLYELAHLWRRQRTHAGDEPELRRARSRAMQRYFAEAYLRDVDMSASGPLCALDIDGVLETEHLGFPAITPAAARTLRALMLHGYRPVLASGRSVGDVAERCRAYGLAGGVAEYGAACVTGSGQVIELLPDGAAATLGPLRSALGETAGVRLDGDYRLAVRAYRVDRHGARRGLEGETIAACLDQAGKGRVRAIVGHGQTDFVIEGVDKAIGLRRLAAELGAGEHAANAKPFALVVGDTVTDIPCADVAVLACAPGHAADTLREAGFERMKAPYQAGLAQAAARLLGHAPGGCSVCRPPPFTRERRLLLSALAVQERGWGSLVAQGLRLGTSIR
jgi:hydroxymethylpyrimidine pyrophosphatase-like HAD family hydrolase